MTCMTTHAGVREVSVAVAKARFAEFLRAVEQGETVVITKHGRHVAAVVPAADAEELRRLRAAGPKTGLASLAGGWTGSDALVKEILRHKRTPPRPTPDLE